MKRKIKRKLFLMGIAITAGLPGVAFAKGSGKAEREAYLHASQWHSVRSSTLAGDMDRGEAESAGFYSKLKTIVDRMNYSVEVPVAQIKPRAWRLEMLQPNISLDQADAPRLSGEKRVGVALRVAF